MKGKAALPVLCISGQFLTGLKRLYPCPWLRFKSKVRDQERRAQSSQSSPSTSESLMAVQNIIFLAQSVYIQPTCKLLLMRTVFLRGNPCSWSRLSNGELKADVLAGGCYNVSHEHSAANPWLLTLWRTLAYTYSGVPSGHTVANP